MALHKVIVVLVVLELTRTVSSYTVQYYDCNEVNRTTTFKVLGTCMGEPEIKTKTSTYTILQKKSVQVLQGWSCKATRSSFTDYCGAYGHSKHIRPPEIERSYVMSVTSCWDLVTTGVFTTPEGLRRKIEIGSENIFGVEELGTINIGDDSVSCQGQPLRVKDHIINDVLVISQWRVTVVKQKYKTKGDIVEATGDHLRLPEQRCSLDKLGCQVHDETYVWNHPSRCPMEEVRTAELTEENGYLVNHKLKIILKIGQLMPTINRCPSTSVFATEYDNLFLTPITDVPQANNWPKMTDDLDMADYIKARDDYTLYSAEQKIRKSFHSAEQKMCTTNIQDDNEALQLTEEKGIFYKRNGDVIERFSCIEKTGEVESASPNCYRDIPLANGGGFVKTSNRLYTRHSAPVPCNTHYGLKIRTNEQQWIELNPDLRRINEPMEAPLHTHPMEHEDLSSGGIFTDSELVAWRSHLELGDIHDAIARTITYSLCQENGDCPASPDMPRTNIQLLPSLRNQLDKQITGGFFARVDDFIQNTGSYVAFIVIIIESIKFANFIVAVSITMATQGITGAKALAWLLCCHDHNVRHKVVRRCKRIDRLRPQDEDDGSREPLDALRMTERSREPDL